MGSGVNGIVILVLVMVCFWVYVVWKNSRKLNDDIRLMAQQHSLIRHNLNARDLCRAIHLLSPHASAGVDYVIASDGPDAGARISEWRADTPQPTTEQIQDAISELSKAHHEEEFAAKRKSEYPSVEDQLDAAWQARQGNDARQRELDEMIRKVKEKYPKTDQCV